MSNVHTHLVRFQQWVNGIEKDANLGPVEKAQIFDGFKETLSGPILTWLAAAEAYQLDRAKGQGAPRLRHEPLQLPAGQRKPVKDAATFMELAQG
jgi:hypothetical protein